MARRSAFIGVSDHGGWAVLITVSHDGAVIDRRRVTLVDADLPSLPHHVQGQGLPIEEAVELVERVRVSASAHSAACFAALAAELSTPIAGVAIRRCPPLPATVAERITNYRAMCNADWVMYRVELAAAAETRGWAVRWYDPKSVFADAARALGRKNVDDVIGKAGAALGSPWQKDHRMAMAAAIAAVRG
jgi:hypothetical protein